MCTVFSEDDDDEDRYLLISDARLHFNLAQDHYQCIESTERSTPIRNVIAQSSFRDEGKHVWSQ
jgi:hypothetical protein